MFQMLKAKICGAVVTDMNSHYNGSISLSKDLCNYVGIKEYEKVLITNIENGQRFDVYVVYSNIPGCVCINGITASLVSVGDHINIMAFRLISEDHVNGYQPFIIHVDEQNFACEEIPEHSSIHNL